MAWSLRRRSVLRKRTVDELAANHPALARTLSDLGYAPGRTAEIRRIVTELRASIKTQIPDFPAFQEHLRSATRSAAQDSRLTAADKQLLERLIATGNNKEGAIAILDHDPVGERLPFVELVPVKRGSGTVWLAPTAEPPLLRRPADPSRFAELLNKLESLFRDPHPAVQDGVRVQVLDAIHRGGRELSRGNSYLVSTIQVLERRIMAYETSGHEPESRMLLDVLLKIIDKAESARSQAPAHDETRRELSQATELYLGYPKLYSRWITGYLMESLLMPAQIQSVAVRSRQSRKMVELICGEIAGGHFNASEIARRLRSLERDGLYFSSLLYALLTLYQERFASQFTRRHTRIENS